VTERDDEIRKQVQDRVAQEAGTAPPEEDSELTSQFIQECLFANEQGDGVLYATLFRDRFLYCKNTMDWYEWQGHSWKRDIMNRSLAAVELLVERYLGEYKALGGKISDLTAEAEVDNSRKIKRLSELQKQLLKRVSQLRADKRRTACLKFSHTIDDPLAITGEEFDNRPMLFPCANGVIDLETGRLHDGRPGDFLSLSSSVSFLGIDAPAPLWEKSIH